LLPKDGVDRSQPRHKQARQFHNNQELTNNRIGLKGAINGKPLDVLSWFASVLVVPPGLHRFMNAAFLSMFLYGGAKASTALAARDLRGRPISAEDVWPIFKPIYGKMEYVWRSAEMPDRWKHVAHQLLPVGVGMFGTYAGSRLYFQEAIDRAHSAEYLEDYTDRVSLEESETYARASAVTSILNTGSGLHLLPFVSYPSNLQNRFLMAKGQQVASPLMGKWWSGNPSHYPWHVRGQLINLVRYAVNNTSEYPADFDNRCYAILAKLYPDMPEEMLLEKRDQMVEKIYEVRDHFWQEGGIPLKEHDEAKEALEGVLRRDGFERTLTEIGLDPLAASLDNNGMSGRVAKWFGASGTVNNTISEYYQKVAKRLGDGLPPASNDNMPADNDNKPETTIKTPAHEKPLALSDVVKR